jgi:LPXTG-motif cell wall-anchored protein
MMRATIRVVLSGVFVCLTAAMTLAQTTTTSETKKFTVISVEGNQLVVRLPEGTREMNVPDDFRFTVDGKSLSVHELKAGMAGTATITTKTTVTPVTVTEVKNGTVMSATGNSVVVRTPDGIKMFSQGDLDKRGVRIMKDGKVADLSDLHTDDKLTAVIITSKPPRVMTEKEVAATLAKAAPAAGAAGAGAGAGAPAAATKPAPAPAASMSGAAPPSAAAGTSSAPARKLPKTASNLPLLGLAGLASLVAGLGLTVRRRRATR